MEEEKISLMADQMGLQTYQAREALRVVLQNLLVFDKKQQDYGSENIAANPCPELGVAIRANDKVQRLMNLLWNEKAPNNESIRDAWSDLANYGLIGFMVNNDTWLEPEVE